MIIMMRTTVNLPDDIYEVVRCFAESKRIPLGQALAELVRKGLRAPEQVSTPDLFPRFTVPDGAASITLERTVSAEDDV